MTVAERARAVAAQVPDPEVPVLTIADLGVLRDVEVAGDGHVIATITPTYSGCPAMAAIREEVALRLAAAGFAGAEVRTVLAPAWTTDWISPVGRRKLAEAGIVPPGPAGPSAAAQAVPVAVERGAPARRVPVAVGLTCPRCGARDTRLVTRFGATACKALHACRACGEPFEEFKAL